MPAGSDGRRPTARAKGKVERAFRTVKEAHETLYHFHKPASEEEANRWLHRFLVQYNAQPHRAGGGSRLDDWHANLPDAGLRVMCSWERYCAFAREPERRKVGSDARVTVEGVVYQLDWTSRQTRHKARRGLFRAGDDRKKGSSVYHRLL
jgi:hypothetical protein